MKQHRSPPRYRIGGPYTAAQIASIARQVLTNAGQPQAHHIHALASFAAWVTAPPKRKPKPKRRLPCWLKVIEGGRRS